MTPPDPASIGVADLLSHSSWLRSLARSLVLDDSRADDLMQQTWVAALERPASDPVRTGSWLRTVARRLAGRTRREESRRLTRESRVATTESVSCEDLVERAELQNRVAASVLRLGEPYRSMVLLRFYEDLSPQQIADRMGIPIATVWTRLSRALERLRMQLDSEYGDRQVWGALLIPLTLVDKSTITTASAATSAGLASNILGGAIMTKKVLFACIVGCLVAGAGIGMNLKDEPAPGISESDHALVVSERDSLSEELERLRSENDARNESRALLAGEVDTLKTRIEEMTLANAKPPEPPTPESSLAIAFGGSSLVPALENAEWETIGKALLVINGEVEKLVETLASGGDIDPGFQARLGTQQMKLQEYAIGIIGKLPTHYTGNGEFCHPLSLANMMSAYLDEAELPLTDAQISEIASLGADYEADWADLESGYDDDTFALTKFLDEMELKDQFVGGFHGSLDPSQRSLLDRPAVNGRNQLDVLSPAVMLAMNSGPVKISSREGARATLVDSVATRLGIDRAHLEGLAAFDTWAEEIDSLLEPVPNTMFSMYRADEAVIAGRAQQKAMEALLDNLELTDTQRDRIVDLSFILVPRVVASD